MKKRVGALILALSLAFSLAAPVFAAELSVPKPTIVTDKPELHLEYMEFYNNQEYYENLVVTHDYRLVIDVGEEYADMERARILKDVETVNTLEPMAFTRGTSMPGINNEWNINTKGRYGFTVDSDYTAIYTDYYFTGANVYLLNVTNTSNVSGGAIAYGTRSGNVNIGPIHGTVIEQFNTLAGSRFYLKFNAPAYLIGSISKVS